MSNSDLIRVYFGSAPKEPAQTTITEISAEAKSTEFQRLALRDPPRVAQDEHS
jgi:hypothetical protein